MPYHREIRKVKILVHKSQPDLVMLLGVLRQWPYNYLETRNRVTHHGKLFVKADEIDILLNRCGDKIHIGWMWSLMVEGVHSLAFQQQSLSVRHFPERLIHNLTNDNNLIFFNVKTPYFTPMPRMCSCSGKSTH